MTIQQFNKVYLEHYDRLVRWANTKVGGDGVDIVQQSYCNALDHQTYKQGSSTLARQWIYFKVAREVVRYRKALKLRQQKTWEGRHILVGAMMERESLERPDIPLLAKELKHK